MLVEKFTYPTLKRVTAKNGQRQYTGDDEEAANTVSDLAQSASQTAMNSEL